MSSWTSLLPAALAGLTVRGRAFLAAGVAVAACAVVLGQRDLLRVAVLAGRVAGLAEPTLRAARPELEVLRMPHPSPTFTCTSPEVPARIRATLAAAATILACGT